MSTPIPKVRPVIGKQYADEIVKLIDKAELRIEILMFDWRWYSADPFSDVSLINHAIIRAVRRGVTVRALTNYNNIVEQLKAEGIEAKLWDQSKLMHSKMIIIDGKNFVLGSHNFTHNAMKNNVETSVILEDSEALAGFNLYFDSLWQS